MQVVGFARMHMLKAVEAHVVLVGGQFEFVGKVLALPGGGGGMRV
ncbi:hypothetical protein ABZU45_34975 [Streptomyces avermitilis]